MPRKSDKFDCLAIKWMALAVLMCYVEQNWRVSQEELCFVLSMLRRGFQGIH